MSKKLGATIDNNINVQVAKKRGRKSKKEIEEAQKNTSKIEENIFVKIVITVSSLNIYYYPIFKYLLFLNSFQISLLQITQVLFVFIHFLMQLL